MPIYSCSRHCSTDVLMALLPVVLSLDSDGGVENQRGDQVCTR